ncbi:MAG TPA: tetratricopeptide repeat protein [Puia sp.]|uniref:tetratricopeptide repeat protein n=1 Tax=Puia sp. TaxID=2045100 RepID=UPI002BEDB653|nr:tetratricopeptide repeat protein [Puia sp.]HVU98394.1 tetratricopeptide repeat protein [Puia sp.]
MFLLLFSPTFAQPIRTRDSVSILQLLGDAEVYKNRSQLDSAAAVCLRAIGMSRAKRFLRGEAAAFFALGDIEYRREGWAEMKRCDSVGLRLGLTLKDSELIARGYYGLGQWAIGTNKKEEALSNLRRALSLYFEREQSAATAGVYNDLGYVYASKGALDSARGWYLLAMRIYDRVRDSTGMAETLSNLSSSSLELGNRADAIRFGRRALAIRERGRDMDVLALSCNNLSQIYLQADSMDQAVYYQRLGLKYAEASGLKLRLAQSFTSMSLLLNRQGKNAEALEYEKKTIALCRETGDSGMLARRYIAAAALSGVLKDSVGAVGYFELCERVSRAINDKMNLRDLFLYRTLFYKDRKDYFRAYENLKKYYSYKDSLAGEETKRNIAEMQTKYETEKKDEEIRAQEQELRLAKAERELGERQLEQQKQGRNLLIGGVVVLGLIAVGFFNRYQLKKKLQQQAALLDMRNHIARDLHDELGSTLTSIHILSQVSRNSLDKDQSRAFSLLEKITDQSRQMQQSMSDIVWAIKSDNDKIENMMVRMREYLAQTLEAKDIDIRFEADEELLGHSFSMQQRKDLLLIFKEAVNNAAKYAGCTRLEVSFRRCGERVVLEVVDDGVGFEVSDRRSGNGLHNMRTRSAALDGECRVESSPGKGTRVVVEMPMAT